jgi:hypothetical protein
LAYLEGKEIVSLVDYAKKYKISHSNVLTTIAGATDFSGKASGTDVIYGVGVDGKINDTIKYRVDVSVVPVSPIRDLYPGKALIAVSKAAPLAAESEGSTTLACSTGVL